MSTDEARVPVEAPLVPVEADGPLPDACRQDERIVAMWLHGKAEKTQLAYRRDVASFLADHRIGEATLADMQAWVDGIGALAPATARRRIAALKSLYTFAHQRIGVLRINPAGALKLPVVREGRAERILPEAVVLRMIAKEDDPRNHALLLFLYGTGARAAEASGVLWKHIGPRERGGQVSLWGKGSKERTVLMPATVYQAVCDLGGYTRPETPVFRSRKGSRAITPGHISDIVKAAARRAGVREPVSAHWLRHAHASHSLDRGASLALIQQTLGHASIATTGRYLHARPNESSGLYLPL